MATSLREELKAKVNKSDSENDDNWSSSDEDDEAKGPPPMLNIEKSADLQAVKSAFLNAADKRSPVPENKPDVEIDKKQYSSVKEKFENIDKITQEPGERKTTIEIERSEAEKKLVQKTFFDAPDTDQPKDCSFCGKIVYPIDRVNVAKLVFHKNCLNCSKCQQRLTAQNYTAYDGKIYCKLHVLEILRPDVAIGYQKGELIEADIDKALEEQGDNVTVSKVSSSLKSADDLENVGSLKDRKSEWTKSAEQTVVKSDANLIDTQMIEHGGVKSKLTKFVEGEVRNEVEPEDDENEPNRDPNVVKSSKKKEKINLEIGAKQIKGKWEAGTVERAQGDTEDRSQELDEIKKGVSVKERFKEKTSAEIEQEEAAKRKSTVAEDTVDTTFSSAAKERFLKGDLFQDANPVEKINVSEQLKFSELSNVKERFEKQPLSDEDVEAARKKELLEQEFKQYQEARKLTQAEDVDGEGAQELASLKQKFEQGAVAFEKKPSDAASATRTLEQSKWTKESGNKPEAVNKRVPGAADDGSGQAGDDYEVKNLLNRFKNIEQGILDEPKGPKPKRQITPPPAGEEAYRPDLNPPLLKEKEIVPSVSPEELARIKVEAKNLMAKFENVEKLSVTDNTAEAEEKRKHLEEEFKKLKELKEIQIKAEEAEAAAALAESADDAVEKVADLAAAAEHAQKSRAKWEKIERKEAKKAQKAAQTARRSAHGAKEV